MKKFTFAIGDIHGCNIELIELLNKCMDYIKENNVDDPTFVFLGDYIDRGPDSAGVIDTILNLKYKKICIRGNHEQMLLDAIRNHIDPQIYVLTSSGGYNTLKSFKTFNFDDIPYKYIEFITKTKFFYKDNKRIYVHAGIMPCIPLHHQTRDDMLWIMQPFLTHVDKHEKYIVHGHTIIDHDYGRIKFKTDKGLFHNINEPLILENRINLDTACVFGRRLTAAVFSDNNKKGAKPIKILQVQKKSTFINGPYLTNNDQ